MSLLETLENALTLIIYLDSKKEAQGYIYLDDGTTFGYRDDCQKTFVRFNFDSNGMLSATRDIEDGCMYDGAATKMITQVKIYGFE